MKLAHQYNFGERLKHLMDSAGIKPGKWGSATALAKAMVEKDCVPFLDNYVYEKRKTSAKTAILRHLKVDSAGRIEGRWIKAYCDFFGCSADYLYGYISEPTHQKTDISEYTGLSEKSIENTKHLRSEQIDALNVLLEDSDFSRVLSDIAKYKKALMDYNKSGEEFVNLLTAKGTDSLLTEVASNTDYHWTPESSKKREDADKALQQSDIYLDAMQYKVDSSFQAIIHNISEGTQN